MTTGYKSIFLGLLLTLFHINLGNLQILPTFVGMLIVSFGIKELMSQEVGKHFKTAYWLCVILVLLTLIDFFRQLMGLSNNGSTEFSVWFIVWMIAYTLIELLLYYTIFCGSIELLNRCHKDKLSGEFLVKQNTVVILYTLTILAQLYSLLFYSEVITVIAVIVAFCIKIWFIVLMYRMKNLDLKLPEEDIGEPTVTTVQI